MNADNRDAIETQRDAATRRRGEWQLRVAIVYRFVVAASICLPSLWVLTLIPEYHSSGHMVFLVIPLIPAISVGLPSLLIGIGLQKRRPWVAWFALMHDVLVMAPVAWLAYAFVTGGYMNAGERAIGFGFLGIGILALVEAPCLIWWLCLLRSSEGRSSTEDTTPDE